MHPRQCHDDRQITERVDYKAGAFAEFGDDDTGQAWTDNPRGVDDGWIERDGIRQIFGIDELVDQRLARRHIEGVYGARECAQHHDVDRLDPAGERQNR